MRKLIQLAAIMLLLGAPVAGIANASGQSGAVAATVTINGRDVATGTTHDPVRLTPGETVDVGVTLTNGTSATVDVHQVQLDAQVLGMTFFSYATGVDVSAAPYSTANVHYRLELTGLSGQATGLLAAAVSLRDRAGNAVAAVPTVVDVRGSLMSVYGLFGLAIAVLTAMSLLDTALAMARHQLPVHRWRRGLRVMIPGVGIGLVAAFTASTMRLWVADTHSWLLLAGGCAAVFFGVGYLSPTPGSDDDTSVTSVADAEPDSADGDPDADDAIGTPAPAATLRT
jgi:hypothetical protein